jgi:hypothetical protein
LSFYTVLQKLNQSQVPPVAVNAKPQYLWEQKTHQGKGNIEEATVRKEKLIWKSKERGEAVAKTDIGRAGAGVERKQEKGIEITTRTGTKGAGVEKEIEIEIGEIGAEAERGTEVEREEREGTGVMAGKREEGQEIGVLVPPMTEGNTVQEVETEIRRLQMELESSWQLRNLRSGR